MNLLPEQIEALSAWKQKSTKSKASQLDEVQQILGLERGCVAMYDYELDGHFAYPADPTDFQPDNIEDFLTQKRLAKLNDGEQPTEKELILWCEWKDKHVFEDEFGWWHFYLWKIELSEETIYFRSLHGDGGILDHFQGPYSSEAEAFEDAGNVVANPRPD